jgi:hypothetical protein
MSFVCNICNKNYSSKQSLNTHTKTIHAINIYKCTYCTRTYNKIKNKYIHEKVCKYNVANLENSYINIEISDISENNNIIEDNNTIEENNYVVEENNYIVEENNNVVEENNYVVEEIYYITKKNNNYITENNNTIDINILNGNTYLDKLLYNFTIINLFTHLRS